MKDDCRYEVSALVVSYNPNYRKMIATIKSLLFQSGITLQIVIADDGSENDYFDELKAYFKEVGFEDYCLVKNIENQGIVKNFISGLNKCEGKYVKPISPGDYMFGEMVLREWIEYMEHNDVTVCGAKYACYYYNSDNKMTASKQKLHPQLMGLTGRKLRTNYIINDDIYLGAATLCVRELLIKYVLMLENKVKYAEDNCYRIMAYCGEKMGAYDKETILYEVGTGISTNGNNEWNKRINKDWLATNDIILKTRTDDKELEKMFKLKLNIKNNMSGRIYRYFKIRGLLLSKIKMKTMPKFSICELPVLWVRRIDSDGI